MPLAFQSLSHGQVAFGFFNIETDMMLLNNIFFFSTDFCAAISELAGLRGHEPAHLDLPAYVLTEKDVGNLHGAIQGLDLSGFIGEVYRHYPHPKDPQAFKQSPEGTAARKTVEGIIGNYARLTAIRVIADRYSDNFIMGPYTFVKDALASLLDYLWVGGMPRWRGGAPPQYVEEMARRIEASVHPTFRNLDAFH